MINDATLDGLMVAGPAVVLTGKAAETALQATLIALRARRRNGLPSPAYQALAEALARTTTGIGHIDGTDQSATQDLSLQPQIPIAEAAKALGVSNRQAVRYATRLGGRKIGGRWFVDEQALTEHIEGRQHKWSA